MRGFDVGDLERRLVRAEISAAAIPWADRKVARHRASLRVQVSLCDLIRQRLQAMGIDPKCAIALRLGERGGGRASWDPGHAGAARVGCSATDWPQFFGG